ncbi:MAG: hypothetical protein CME70_11560 [Halobacteriovorax sp.]|nr:hypothetical protein [Halobacteriovorax sp.]|tara:strand:- start:47184 stop:48923 length:1740 start_codon:yes stop_codon:yes gene_type:complete
MNLLMKKIILVLVMSCMVMTAYANVGNPGVKYGPSTTWNAGGDTKTNLANLKKRSGELRKMKKELQKKKRKTKGKEAKKAVQKEIDDVSKEMKKVFDDYDFEDGLTTNPRKPKKKPEARAWKQKMRQERLKKMQEKQKKWEEKQKKKRERARRVSDLSDLGDVTIGDVSSANTDVMNSQRDLEDVEDQIEEAKCEEVNDENQEICIELGNARTEASATLEESEREFGRLANALPPLLIGGGTLYVIYDRMTELRESYARMRDVNRELINCEENCEVIKRQVENIKNSLQEQEGLDKTSLDEAQDEVKQEEIGGPVDAELIIPSYLSENNEIPFGNKNELPIILAVDSTELEDVVKSAQATVNGKAIELVYYPERGIFTGSYAGYGTKEELVGKTEIELIDGQVLTGSFSGRINTEKPNVEIKSTPGSVFKKGKFKIHVTGEFDKIEISGDNVKSQTIKFETMKTSHKMTVKASKKGSATINVVATRTSKNVRMPEFDGETLATDEEGRVLREDDYFQEIDLGRSKAKELGFCCEDMNELTCEGCIAGKRSRKSCKALNKLPGYNFKAFLVAKSLSCTKL